LLRQLEAVRQKLEIAKTDLASLINLPPGENYRVLVPAASQMTYEPMAQPVEALEELAMLRNPDLRELSYEARISADETRKSMLKLLPGINLNYGGNFDSNSFLLHHWWAEGTERVTWNLLGLLSLPATLELGRDSEALAELRRRAVAMAVLAKLHIAYQQYIYAGHEYQRARELSRVDRRIYAQISNRTAANAQSMLERIVAEVYLVTSELRQYDSYADLQAALGRLYATVGLDSEPKDLWAFDLRSLTSAVHHIMAGWKRVGIKTALAAEKDADRDGSGVAELRRELDDLGSRGN
jgi:outer membrane protein TolC